MGFGQLKLDNNTKMLYYQSERKSAVTAMSLDFLFPTLGYKYLNNMKRGLLINGLQLALFIDSNQKMQSANAINAYNSAKRKEKERLIEKADIESGIAIIIVIYEMFDLLQETNNYNNKLYNKIFEGNNSPLDVSLQTTNNGANLNFTYNFK